MKTFELSKDIQAKFPENIDEVTFEQYLKVCAKDVTNIDILEALSGVSKDIWMQCSDDNIDTVILPHLEFISENIETLSVPDKIELAGKTIKVPKDLGFETFGQKVICQDAIVKEDKESGEIQKVMPFIVAVYLQPQIDKEFSEEKARKLIPEILKKKVTEIYPLGFFLLAKLVASLNVKLNYLVEANTLMRNFGQESKT